MNVFNLLEGEEVIVESRTEAFEPFVVHNETYGWTMSVVIIAIMCAVYSTVALRGLKSV